MRRSGLAGILTILLAVTGAGLVASPAQAHPGPKTYVLNGAPGDPAGSKFEGIGVDRKQRTFYVSETTGGEIHRGKVHSGATKVWKDAGVDGRVTARGITVDKAGRVYIAGGPNSLPSTGGTHDFWVYSKKGKLLAALDTGVANPFLNDVAIGPDGAAYVTNSNSPIVFRVAKKHGKWTIKTWADGTGTIATAAGFNLGGIVVSPNRRSLIVAQGNVGKLWRFNLRTKKITQIDSGKADLVNADGLVRRGQTLWVIRNFSRVLTKLHVSRGGASAQLVSEQATDSTRVFTTGKIARGWLLLVDSKFDEPVAAPPYEVVALPLGR